MMMLHGSASTGLLRIVLLVSAAVLWASTAYGASEAVCNQYAQEAVAAQQRNEVDGCGLAGDRWSSNFWGHRSWCLGASQASVDNEANARRADLARCTECVSYAIQAVEAQRQNINNHCGLTGDPWSDHFGNHLSWCMGASQASIAGENNNRRGHLTKCTHCISYAQQAIDAQRENNNNHCGLTGDRWSPQFNDHRSWCMGVAQSTSDWETNGRREDLAKCTRCAAYAQEAVGAQEQNMANECCQAGDRWSPNGEGHRAWCMGAPQSIIDAETNARRRAVERCLNPCRTYTLEALEAQRQNQSHSCGLVGDRWSLNACHHMAWCIGAPQAHIDWEAGERKKQAGACVSPGRKAACEAYARKAISQFVTARGNSNCDRRDERRWHDNFQNHFGWCMAVDTGEPPVQTKLREDELKRCASIPPASSSGPSGAEPCLVSVIVRNGECLNLNGTPSTIFQPGTRQVTGCGSDVEKATERAKIVFQATGVCLSEGDEPAPGCCTFEEEPRQGCLCTGG